MSEEAGTVNGCGGCLIWGLLLTLLFGTVVGIIALFDEPEQGIKMLLGVALCCLCFFLVYLIEKFEKAIGASATKTPEQNRVVPFSKWWKVRSRDENGKVVNAPSPLPEEEWQKENPWAPSSTSAWRKKESPNPYEIPKREQSGNLQVPVFEKARAEEPPSAGSFGKKPEPFSGPHMRIEREQMPLPSKPVPAMKPPRIRKPASSAQTRSVPTRRVRLKDERARLKDL